MTSRVLDARRRTESTNASDFPFARTRIAHYFRLAMTRKQSGRCRTRSSAARATLEAEVVQLAVDLLVREPDIEGFFGSLTKTMVEDTGSEGCAVWLLDDQ